MKNKALTMPDDTSRLISLKYIKTRVFSGLTELGIDWYRWESCIFGYRL